MPTTPGTLSELQAIPDPAQRAVAAGEYIAAREHALDQARRIRDKAILVLLETGTARSVSEQTGMSVGHVKKVQGWGRFSGDVSG